MFICVYLCTSVVVFSLQRAGFNVESPAAAIRSVGHLRLRSYNATRPRRTSLEALLMFSLLGSDSLKSKLRADEEAVETKNVGVVKR